MGRFSIILSIFILPFLLQGQTRLTDFTSAGSNNLTHLKTIEGVNYFLTINQNNDLAVFNLKSENEKEFLHSRNFQGIFDNIQDVKFLQNNIVFATDRDIVEYNFVSDEILKTSLPDDYYFSSSSYFEETSPDRVFMSLKNLDQSDFKGLVYEIGGTVFNYHGGAIGGIFGDELFDSRSTSQNLRDHYFYNLITEEEVVVATGLSYNQNPLQIDDYILFYKGGGTVHKFDLNTRQVEPLKNVKLSQNFGRNSILADENKLYLVSSGSETSIVNIYEKSSYQLLKTVSVDLGYLNSSSFIYKDILVHNPYEFDLDLHLVNLENGQHLTRPTTSCGLDVSAFLEHRYLLNPYLSEDDENILELIDLADLSSVEVKGDFNLPYICGLEYAIFGQTHLINFVDPYGISESILNLDLNNNKAEANTALDQTNSGMEAGSFVFEAGNSNYLWYKGIYEIKDNEVKLIFDQENTLEIEYYDFIINDGKVMILQDWPRKILSYDGEQIKEEADLSDFEGSYGTTTIRKLIVMADYVLLMDVLGKMYRYDKTDKNIEQLDDHSFSEHIPMFAFHNSIYFSNGGGALYKTDGYTATKITDNYLGAFDQGTGGYKVFKEQLYTLTTEGLVRIEMDGDVTLIDSSFDPRNPDEFFITDKSGDNLLIGDNINKVVFNGNETTTFQLAYGDRTFLTKGSTKDVFFFREYEDNIVTKTFFHSQTKEYAKLPEELQAYDVVDYFESNDQGFLLMSSGFEPFDKFYIYKTDATFDQVDLVQEYADAGWLGYASFSKFYDEGFLYAGDLIFLMNEENEFIPIENIKGIPNQNFSTVGEEDGELYFLAIDPIHGRQLFTIELYSFRVGTEDAYLNPSSLKILPNPAKDFIGLESELFEAHTTLTYTIFDLNGRLVESGTTNGNMDVKSLNAGSYLLKISDQEKSVSNIFLKL